MSRDALLAVAAGLLLARSLSRPRAAAGGGGPRVLPAYETCFRTPSSHGVLHGAPPSVAAWEVVAGANGTSWAVDRRDPSRRFCYPHGSTPINGTMRYPGFVSERRWQRLRRAVRLRPGDIVIATFPKAGTTWMEQIVLLLLQRGDASKLNPEQQNALPFNAHGVGSVWLERYVEALDEEGPPALSLAEWEALPSPRLIKTHALPSLLVGLPEGADALLSLIHI